MTVYATKKPITIEARQTGVDYDEDLAIMQWCGGTQGHGAEDGKLLFTIPTLEGPLEVTSGDWIIRGIAGEFYPCKPDIFEATYDTPSEGDFPCCEDGEHVPAEIAGDLFTATLNRAQWHRVDEALAAHGRNDAVWSQIAATKTAVRPTPPELEREGDAASRVATPSQVVAALSDADLWDFADDLLAAWDIEDENPPSLSEQFRDMFVARFGKVAAVPADGETEWTTEPDATHLRDLRADSRVRSSLDLIREANSVRDLDGTGIVGRLADMLAGWLPIPEGSAD